MKRKEVNISEESLKDSYNISPFSNKKVESEKMTIKNQVSYGNGLNLLVKKTSENASKLFLKVKGYYSQRKKTVILAIILVTVAIISVISFFIALNSKSIAPSSIINFSESYISAKYISQNNPLANLKLLRAPLEPKSFNSPINGMLFTKAELELLKSQRPIAVLIDNEVSARIQTGISQADLVYEAPVEGGITRIMGIYWSNKVNTVGPIRSARNYFIDWFSPFDALFIHDGCASSTDSRVDSCGNITAYNVKDIGTFGSWRDSTNGKVAPHNEYSSPIKAWDYAKNNGWTEVSEIDSWKFKNDANLNDRGSKTDVKVAFSGGAQASNYTVEWIYNKNENNYSRKIGGISDIDSFSMKQITAKVVIIEENVITQTYDSLSHIIIETTGTGNAKILQDGKIASATWKKDSRTTRTKYYDKDSNEIIFNRGIIWIESLPRNDGKFTIIEQ
jgi:hypothetical protein